MTTGSPAAVITSTCTVAALTWRHATLPMPAPTSAGGPAATVSTAAVAVGPDAPPPPPATLPSKPPSAARAVPASMRQRSRSVRGSAPPPSTAPFQVASTLVPLPSNRATVAPPVVSTSTRQADDFVSRARNRIGLKGTAIVGGVSVGSSTFRSPAVATDARICAIFE